MKITAEHFAQIKAAFKNFGADSIAKQRAFLLSPENPRPPKDLETRLAWDVMWSTLGAKWICDNIYSYANDSHILTAIKAAIAAVESEAREPKAKI